MTNLALDTNIWIYLTKDTFSELFDTLKKMDAEGEVRVIVNDIIRKEWKRNKEKTIQSHADNIKNEFKSALNLGIYLDDATKQTYTEILSAYKDEGLRIEKATAKVNAVEAFMESCVSVPVTKEQILFIANLAIEKAPPFQNNKNNFNDALILRSICQFAKNEVPQLYDLIYVSNNPDDFTDKSTKMMYPHVLDGLTPIRLMNVSDLGHAFHLAPQLIEDFDAWIEAMLDDQAMHQLDIQRGK